MTAAPLVSILIPAFNAERWIGATLESALAQTWPRTEIIVVDDGSTDATAAIAVGYEGPRLKVVRQPRRGGSAAQNEAYRHAQGDFIQRLDADDLLGPDKIARQMARIADEPSSIACGDWARFYETPSEATFGASNVSEDLEPVEWLLRVCDGGQPMLQPGLWLVPRCVVEAAGDWNERLTLNNDFEYFVRVLLAARLIRYTAGARLYYRSGHSGSLGSTRTPEGWESAWLAFDLGVRYLLAHEQSDRARGVAADLFKVLAYDAYLEDARVTRMAEARVNELGGSSVRMGGGMIFTLLERSVGWKVAKRAKAAAYRAGYLRLTGGRPRGLPVETMTAL